jgi:hypothetical protein
MVCRHEPTWHEPGRGAWADVAGGVSRERHDGLAWRSHGSPGARDGDYPRLTRPIVGQPSSLFGGRAASRHWRNNRARPRMRSARQLLRVKARRLEKKESQGDLMVESGRQEPGRREQGRAVRKPEQSS